MHREARGQVLDAHGIGFVVHLAREVIERVDRHAFVVAERDESPVEVAGFALGHVAIEALGTHLIVFHIRASAQRPLQVDHYAGRLFETLCTAARSIKATLVRVETLGRDSTVL